MLSLTNLFESTGEVENLYNCTPENSWHQYYWDVIQYCLEVDVVASKSLEWKAHSVLMLCRQLEFSNETVVVALAQYNHLSLLSPPLTRSIPQTDGFQPEQTRNGSFTPSWTFAMRNDWKTVPIRSKLLRGLLCRGQNSVKPRTRKIISSAVNLISIM